MGRSESGWRAGLAGAWLVVLGGGCGPDRFAPPKALKAVSTSESSGEAKSVYMVITGPPDKDMEAWAMAAKRTALDRRAIFKLSGPGPGDPPSKQGWAIRNAAGDGADSMVVLANDDPDTAEALDEAREKGVAVVLFGRPVAPKPGKPPYTIVAPEPPAASARRLVETALADAVKNGRPADGEALIFSPKSGDLFAADRLAALVAAAGAAKCRKVEVITFEGTPQDALAGVVAKIKARPDVAILLGDGDEGSELAVRARYDLKGSPLVFTAGYAGIHGQFSPNPFFDESAFAEFRPDNMARLAIQTALARASGEAGDAVVTLPTKFNRGTGSTKFGVSTLGTDLPSAADLPPKGAPARELPKGGKPDEGPAPPAPAQRPPL